MTWHNKQPCLLIAAMWMDNNAEACSCTMVCGKVFKWPISQALAQNYDKPICAKICLNLSQCCGTQRSWRKNNDESPKQF